jgi:Domain of unknown function (DUF4158)
MPGQFLSHNDRENLRRYPTEVHPQVLSLYFALTEDDKHFVWEHRGKHNRLGVALQLCTLRWLGHCPDNLDQAPNSAIQFVAMQLGIPDDQLGQYGQRSQTRTEHLNEVQEYIGFYNIAPTDLQVLVLDLVNQAPVETENRALLDRVCDYLRTHRIVRPGTTRLERLIVAARRRKRSPRTGTAISG